MPIYPLLICWNLAEGIGIQTVHPIHLYTFEVTTNQEVDAEDEDNDDVDDDVDDGSDAVRSLHCNLSAIEGRQ